GELKSANGRLIVVAEAVVQEETRGRYIVIGEYSPRRRAAKRLKLRSVGAIVGNGNVVWAERFLEARRGKGSLGGMGRKVGREYLGVEVPGVEEALERQGMVAHAVASVQTGEELVDGAHQSRAVGGRRPIAAYSVDPWRKVLRVRIASVT